FRDRVERIRARVRQDPDLARLEVIVASTHNHEGPDTLGLWGPNPVTCGADPAYLDFEEDAVLEAITVAHAARAPATLFAGEGPTEGLVHDSRQPIVKDETVRVLEARAAAGGAPIASILVFSSHPEAAGPKNTLLTADFPCAARHVVEGARGSRALFLAGSIGGLLGPGPIRMRDPRTGDLAPEDSIRNADLYGEALGRFALRALERAEPVRDPWISYARRPLEVPIENHLYLLAARLGVILRRDLRNEGRPVEGPSDLGEGAVTIPTEVGRLRIGEVDWLLVPGEIYPELVFGGVLDPPDPGADFPKAEIEPSVYGQLRGRHRMLVGMANDEIGYIIPKRQWDEKAPFCYGRKKAPYGEVNSCGPETAPILCEAFRELVRGKK
ncbi:MAG: neutral/alkaline non-lysosomal ceramidase N-terminal domain-containing protein, partial [Planctomycetota bacterium]